MIPLTAKSRFLYQNFAKRVTGFEPVPPVWKTGMQPKTPRAQKAAGGNRTRISAMAKQYITFIRQPQAGEGSACFLSPYILFFCLSASGQSRNRTCNKTVNSRLLCRLSYMSEFKKPPKDGPQAVEILWCKFINHYTISAWNKSTDPFPCRNYRA